jgi:predicted nucleotidyltransferase
MIAEQDLTDLVTRLKDAAGSNLLSVILYGSAATEEFHEGHSDLNVLCIMQSLGRDDLSKLHAASAWWVKKGHPAPLFFTLDELHHSADIFAIELLDIKAAHRVLHGEDVIASLHVPMDLHRLHVERELRNNTLRLRQHYLRHPADSRKTLELMTSSISSFAALFRHALIALGEDPPPTKRSTMDRLGSVLGFDPSPFHTYFDIREGHKRERDVDVQATFDAYLDRVVQGHGRDGPPAGSSTGKGINSADLVLGPERLFLAHRSKAIPAGRPNIPLRGVGA